LGRVSGSGRDILSRILGAAEILRPRLHVGRRVASGYFSKNPWKNKKAAEINSGRLDQSRKGHSHVFPAAYKCILLPERRHVQNLF
jgi:hypothetical protein